MKLFYIDTNRTFSSLFVVRFTVVLTGLTTLIIWLLQHLGFEKFFHYTGLKYAAEFFYGLLSGPCAVLIGGGAILVLLYFRYSSLKVLRDPNHKDHLPLTGRPLTNFWMLSEVWAVLFFGATLSATATISLVSEGVLDELEPLKYKELNDLVFNGFKVPISILAATLALLALCATNHRSEQTKHSLEKAEEALKRSDRQIEIASEQNRFSNYYIHIEEFSKFMLPTVERLDPVLQVDVRALHDLMYPGARMGEYDLGNSAWQEFNRYFSMIIEATDFVDSLNPENLADGIWLLRKNDRSFVAYCGAGVKWTKGMEPLKHPRLNKLEVLDSDKGYAEHVYRSIFIMTLMIDVLKFSGHSNSMLAKDLSAARKVFLGASDAPFSKNSGNFYPTHLRKDMEHTKRNPDVSFPEWFPETEGGNAS